MYVGGIRLMFLKCCHAQPCVHEEKPTHICCVPLGSKYQYDEDSEFLYIRLLIWLEPSTHYTSAWTLRDLYLHVYM